MKERIKAFFSAIAVMAILTYFFNVLEESVINLDSVTQGFKTFKGVIFVFMVFVLALSTFVYHLGRWIWHADHINRKSQHVKLLGSIMLLLWAIGWLLFIQAFMFFAPCYRFVTAELLLRSAIASLDLFMLDIDSNILDGIKHCPMLKGAISFVSILSFLCTIGLLLSLVSERLWAYLMLKSSRVKKVCPHVYVFFGLNEETEILAKDVKDKDCKSVRIVVEQTDQDKDDDKGGWGRVVNIITHRKETFQKVNKIGARLSLTSVDISEMEGNQRNVFGEANLTLVKKKICRLAKITNREDRKLHIFFLSDNEEKNILSAAVIREDDTIKEISSLGVRVVIYCHARYDSVNRVIEESSPIKNVEIRIVDSSRLSVELLKRNVDNHPVKFVEIDGEVNPGTVKSAFNSLVIGLGETGRDAVRFLYEYGAFMSYDSSNDEAKRSEFHCYIVDKDMPNKEGLFINSATETVKAKNNDGSELLKFIHADTGSVAFFEQLHKISTSLNYVVVAMGTDIENMTLAVRITKCLMADGNDLKNTRILVRICNNAHVEHFRKIAEHYNNSIGCEKRKCMEVFGGYNEIFSYSLVVEDQFKEEAKLFYDRYQEMMQEKEPALKNGSWDERRDELLGFCKKVVAEIPASDAMQLYNEGKPVNAKMKPTGLFFSFEYVDGERVGYPTYKNLRKLRRQTEQDVSNAWHQLTKRELMEESINQNLTFTELYDAIQKLQDPEEGKEYCEKYDSLGDHLSKLILNLAITEHLRWNASHEMLGYRRGDKTDELKQIHNCLVSWKELDDVSERACEEAKENVNNGKTWDYDFSKTIKKEHPLYRSKVKAYVLYLPDYKKYDFAVVETTIGLLKKEEERRNK